MANDVTDFYGKDVASAIKEACTTLGVAQENLNVEVIDTGSAGIFGLIRKKAHIKVGIQEREEKEKAEAPAKSAKPGRKKPSRSRKNSGSAQPPITLSAEETDLVAAEVQPLDSVKLEEDDNGESNSSVAELSPETLTLIEEELKRVLELMHCPSAVTVENQAGTAHCKVSPDFEDVLTSQDGKTLDSLQYLLRKIVSKKVPGRVNLSIDVGNYREQRQKQLEELALEYSARVKEDGKTQVISSLNPSERRVVHVVLQDDPDIRSRSIGDGLFKKVLIYKPGKGRKNNNRKRPRGKSRKKGNIGQNNGSS